LARLDHSDGEDLGHIGSDRIGKEDLLGYPPLALKGFPRTLGVGGRNTLVFGERKREIADIVCRLHLPGAGCQKRANENAQDFLCDPMSPHGCLPPVRNSRIPENPP